MRTTALLLALVLAPGALALDVLPTDAVLGDTQARVVVRTRDATLNVSATPPVLAGAEGAALGSTPRTVAANGTWHGLEGAVVVVLEREDARTAVDLVIEDGSSVGLSFAWPATSRALPAPPLVGLLGLAALAALGRRRR